MVLCQWFPDSVSEGASSSHLPPRRLDPVTRGMSGDVEETDIQGEHQVVLILVGLVGSGKVCFTIFCMLKPRALH